MCYDFIVFRGILGIHTPRRWVSGVGHRPAEQGLTEARKGWRQVAHAIRCPEPQGSGFPLQTPTRRGQEKTPSGGAKGRSHSCGKRHLSGVAPRQGSGFPLHASRHPYGRTEPIGIHPSNQWPTGGVTPIEPETTV